jgi:hypothetical protein
MYVTVDEVLTAYGWPDTSEMRDMVEDYISTAEDLINQYLGYSFDVVDSNAPNAEHSFLLNHDFGPTIRLNRPARSISKVEVVDEDGGLIHEITKFYTYPTAAHTSRLDGAKNPMIFRITEDIVGDEDYHKQYLLRRGANSVRVTGVWGTANVPNVVKFAVKKMVGRLSTELTSNPRVKMEQGVGRTVEFHDPSEVGNTVMDDAVKDLLQLWRLSPLSEV